MKKVLSLIAAFALLLSATACGSTQDDIYYSATHESEASESSGESSEQPMVIASEPESDDPTQNFIKIPQMPNPSITPIPNDDLSGELHIKTFYWRGDPPEVYLLAEEFMQLHPEVNISFDYDIDAYLYRNLSISEQEQQKRDYYTRLRTELASGDADYILHASSDELDLDKFTKNGILRDMRPYWDEDSDIDESGYFMEVLNALSVDGKMTVIPLSFSIPGAFLNRKAMDSIGVDTDEITSVSSAELLGWYEQAREKDDELQFLFSAPGKDTLYDYERYSYIDLDTQTASFDSPEFIDFLKDTENVIDDDPELGEILEKGYGTAPLANELLRYKETGKYPTNVVSTDGPNNYWCNIVTKGRTSFAQIEDMSYYEADLALEPLEYMAGPYPMLSTDGKMAINTGEDFTVPSSCKNPDLAWEFIKYCISDRESFSFSKYNMIFTSHIPINRQVLDLAIDDFVDNISYKTLVGFPVIESVDKNKLTEVIERYLSYDLVNPKSYNIDVSDILDDYYISGLTTAEECAKQLQDRVSIWLNE